MTSVPAPDRLLADTAWLRRLAQHLTGDPVHAADLQQDVTVAALAQPCQAAAGRSWLAAVARNLATSLRRRRAVEQRVMQRLPLRDPVPSSSELAAEAELQQKAVAAVLALPEVYRDTVLLRFMQGLSLQATAEAMGVPEETVRTRQKRALAMLREQLAPPARERRGLAALLGGLVAWGVAMKVKTAVVTAAILLLSLLVAVWCWPAVSVDPTPPSGTGAMLQARHEVPAVGGKSIDPGQAPVRTVAPPLPPPADGSITVHVTWKDSGAPAEGIAVLCRRRSDSGTIAATDAEGIVKFSGLDADEWQLRLRDWYGEHVRLEPGQQARIEHAMERGRAVHGTVTDPDGRPVPGATILISAAGFEPQWLFPAGRSDEQGRFACDGLRLNAMVGAVHELHGTSEFRTLLEDQGVARPEEVNLRLLGAGVSLRGSVRDGQGQPVAGAWVKLGSYRHDLRMDEHGHMWQATPPAFCTTTGDGSFTAALLPPGDCEVEVYRKGFAPHRSNVTLDANGPKLAVVLLPGAVLTGSVRDAAGRAVAGSVSLDPSDFPRRCNQELAEDGTFRFEDVPPGEVTIEVIADGFPDQKRTFTVTGVETPHWDVVMRADAGIRGRLVDEKGKAMTGWLILMPGASRFSTTDEEGRFVMPESAESDNTLLVSREPFGPVRTRFTGVSPKAEEQTFTVTAASAPSATVRGTACTSDGKPLGSLRIYLEQDDRPVDLEQDKGAADGTFTIGPLPPGSYALSPQHPEYAFPLSAVELKAGETRDLGRVTGVRWARLSVRLSGTDAACAAATVELVAGERRVKARGQGRERTALHVYPDRYRLVIRLGDREQDAGEIEFAEGAELERALTVR